ncbi:MAG: hypothetical protein ACRD1R_04365 [Acidobacteriota bacterium]
MTKKLLYIGFAFLLVLLAAGIYWSLNSSVDSARPVSAAVPTHSAAPDPRVEKVEQLLYELEVNGGNGSRAGKTYLLTQPDLNAFLAARLREEDRKGVEDIKVELRDGSFITRVLLNMDELEVEGNSMALGLFQALLSGKQNLEVEGELTARDGKGSYRVLSARMNNISVPATLVNTLLSTAGKNQEPPFDPTEPFEMPYGIKTVKVQTGRVTIST